jgi:AcrR family transcriptional regulator
MTAAEVRDAGATTRGRPRRLDPVTERTALLDAAVRVMARNGYLAMSVSDVLEEARLSTRSFYRHFESKEILVRAALDREVDSVTASLRRAVESAPGPREALDAWVDTMIDRFFDPRRAARKSVFADATARTGDLVGEEITEIRWRLAEPLAEALGAGHRAGVLRSPTPRADAMSVFVILATVSNAPHARLRTRRAVARHVRRFAWPAFGLDPPE